MPLKQYKCKLDGYVAEGNVGLPEVFFQHMQSKHAVDIMISGIQLARKWIAENVEETPLVSSE